MMAWFCHTGSNSSPHTMQLMVLSAVVMVMVMVVVVVVVVVRLRGRKGERAEGRQVVRKAAEERRETSELKFWESAYLA
jgi:uncharacterized membrane protein